MRINQAVQAISRYESCKLFNGGDVLLVYETCFCSLLSELPCLFSCSTGGGEGNRVGGAAFEGTVILMPHRLHRTVLPRVVSGTDRTVRHFRLGQISLTTFPAIDKLPSTKTNWTHRLYREYFSSALLMYMKRAGQ